MLFSVVTRDFFSFAIASSNLVTSAIFELTTALINAFALSLFTILNAILANRVKLPLVVVDALSVLFSSVFGVAGGVSNVGKSVATLNTGKSVVAGVVFVSFGLGLTSLFSLKFGKSVVFGL